MDLFTKKKPANDGSYEVKRAPDAFDMACEAAKSMCDSMAAPESVECEKCGVARKKRIRFGITGFDRCSHSYEPCPCGKPNEYTTDWLDGVAKIPESEYRGSCTVCGVNSPGRHKCQACVDHDNMLADAEFSKPDRHPDIGVSWCSGYRCGDEWRAGDAAQRAAFLGRLEGERKLYAMLVGHRGLDYGFSRCSSFSEIEMLWDCRRRVVSKRRPMALETATA